MDKNKKILIIGGIVEAAILIFALVLSIIVWTTITKVPEGQYMAPEVFKQSNIDKNGAFIAFFQNNTTAFFCIICIPVFVLIAVDFIYFAVIASRRETNLSSKQMAELKKRAEEEVRAEMMKEMEEELFDDLKDDAK